MNLTPIDESTIAALEKDESIRSTLTRLSQRLSESKLGIIDYWDADLYAIGVSRPERSGMLVYFSTYGLAQDKYYCEVEASAEPDSGLPYRTVTQFDQIDFDRLVEIVGQHLGL